MYVMGCDFCQESWRGLDTGPEHEHLVSSICCGKPKLAMSPLRKQGSKAKNLDSCFRRNDKSCFRNRD
jgi:hypothetical protein